MEWLPFLFVAVSAVGLAFYYIVKLAVKEALKEYFQEQQKK